MSAQWPVFDRLTNSYIQNLLVTNPTALTFPLGINGNFIATGDASKPFIDVLREQLIQELANRSAANKQNSITYSQQIYDFATTIGSNALAVSFGSGTDYPSAPAGGVGSGVGQGGPNPCQNLAQTA